MENPAGAAGIEQRGVARPRDDCPDDAQRTLTHEVQDELAQDHGFIDLAVRKVSSRMHDEVENEQASEGDLEQLA